MAAEKPWYQVLPAVNASLNGVGGLLLLIGFVLIKRKNVRAHRFVMLSAFGVSVVFLISYLTYHGMKEAGEGEAHTTWEVDGFIRYFYFFVLATHVVLAACVPVLAMVTIRYGLKGKVDRHRRIAKITWPIWMYVSVTGVLVYMMLYHVQPAMLSGR